MKKHIKNEKMWIQKKMCKALFINVHVAFHTHLKFDLWIWYFSNNYTVKYYGPSSVVLTQGKLPVNATGAVPGQGLQALS